MARLIRTFLEKGIITQLGQGYWGVRIPGGITLIGELVDKLIACLHR